MLTYALQAVDLQAVDEVGVEIDFPACRGPGPATIAGPSQSGAYSAGRFDFAGMDR